MDLGHLVMPDESGRNTEGNHATCNPWGVAGEYDSSEKPKTQQHYEHSSEAKLEAGASP